MNYVFCMVIFLSVAFDIAQVFAEDKLIVGDTLTPYKVEADNQVVCGSQVTMHFDARKSVKEFSTAMMMVCLSKEDVLRLLNEQGYIPIKDVEEMTGYHFASGKGPITEKLFKDVASGRDVFSHLFK